jgi:hypothetical protein
MLIDLLDRDELDRLILFRTIAGDVERAVTPAEPNGPLDCPLSL